MENLLDVNEKQFNVTSGAKPLVKWANPPTVKDLKQDFADARPSHYEHRSRIGEWLDNLHVRGNAKVDTGPGKSSIVPKLIRKQAEWR